MITSYKYANLERVIHKFTQHDIEEALRQHYKIKHEGQSSFELFETEQDKERTMAILTITFEKPKEYCNGLL